MNWVVVSGVCVILGVVGAVVTIGLSFRAQARERDAAERAAARERLVELEAARGRGYSEGQHDTHRELDPQIALLTSQRDDARRERDNHYQQQEQASRRAEALEAEIRRLMQRRRDE